MTNEIVVFPLLQFPPHPLLQGNKKWPQRISSSGDKSEDGGWKISDPRSASFLGWGCGKIKAGGIWKRLFETGQGAFYEREEKVTFRHFVTPFPLNIKIDSLFLLLWTGWWKWASNEKWWKCWRGEPLPKLIVRGNCWSTVLVSTESSKWPNQGW